ncbi:uncharacterized protein LOC135806713 [Sycon ciliatum]|uniref:uncharacterized protein LOC135806713 n=1 Tax=Sycon ciliatum TaxID=27933 RepID=UPI0031F6B9CE
MSSASAPRTSQRSTKGVPPLRYGHEEPELAVAADKRSSVSAVPSRASSGSQLKVELKATELEAAEELATMELDVKKREIELRKDIWAKKLALEEAIKTEQLSQRSSPRRRGHGLTAEALAKFDDALQRCGNTRVVPAAKCVSLSRVDQGRVVKPPVQAGAETRGYDSLTEHTAAVDGARNMDWRMFAARQSAGTSEASDDSAVSFSQAQQPRPIWHSAVRHPGAAVQHTMAVQHGKRAVHHHHASVHQPVAAASYLVRQQPVLNQLPVTVAGALSMPQPQPPPQQSQPQQTYRPQPRRIVEHQTLPPDMARVQKWADGIPDGWRQGIRQAQIKPLELPKFNGEESSYMKWQQRFLRLVDEDPYVSDHYKMARLREAVAGGAAEDLIADLLDGEGAYQSAMAELDAWYGGSQRELERQQKELYALPRIQHDKDTTALQTLAIKLRNVLLNMQAGHIMPGREMYVTVTQKLPRNLLLRYIERYDDATGNVDDLSRWLLDRVHRMRQVDARIGDVLTVKKPEKAATGRTQGHHTMATIPAASSRTTSASAPEPRTTVCPVCQGHHALAVCAELRKMSVRERWGAVKPLYSVCTNCLQTGHRSNDCSAKPCDACGRKHNSLLHVWKSDKPHINISTTDAKARHTAVSSSTQAARQHTASPTASVPSAGAALHILQEPAATLRASGGMAFMTVSATLVNKDRQMQVTALLDSASSTSYVTESVAQELGLTGPQESLQTTVLGGKTVSGTRPHINVGVQTQDGRLAQFSAWVLPAVTPMSTVDWAQNSGTWAGNIEFQPLPSPTVGILIGLNAAELHTSLEERSGHSESGLIARRTPLGWVCFGPLGNNSTALQHTCIALCTEAGVQEESKLDEIVHKFWETEKVGTEAAASNVETPSPADRQAELHTNNTVRYEDGRYTMSIPWASSQSQPQLTSNRIMAEQRLRSLEKALDKRPAVKKQYHEVMNSHIEKGYVSMVPTEQADGEDQWYLPHFPVVRDDKSTTKVRIVFDAAAECNGVSINDEMLTGPALQNDVSSVLLRFCMEPVALVADIAEMFPQVVLAESDRKYHRFLWRVDGEVCVFEWNRLVFGIKASPYLAGKAVKKTLEHFGDGYSAAAVEAIDKSTYVDDLLSSAASDEAACNTQQQTQCLLAQGGFHLRKWLSNSAAVMESIPEADRAKEAVLNLGERDAHSCLTTVKTLGVSWHSQSDTFTFRYQQTKQSPTKRSVLSGLSTVFDPRGQIAPFTIRARILFQDLCLLGVGWDERLPSAETKKWQAWFGELPGLSGVQAPRSFKAPGAPESQLSVHTFVDASDRAIAASAYVRAVDTTGNVRVTLAMAKAKPAPIRRQSIPQLELRGAVLGIRVSQHLEQAIGIPISQHTFWTDSMNVLGWIRNHSRRYKVDIGNRVSLIQEVTSVKQWHHISGKNNPADKATRGLLAEDLANDTLWWNGPAFLSSAPEDDWPKLPDSVPTAELPGQLKRMIEATLVTVPAEDEQQTSRLNPVNFSSWLRLVRVTAWCKRFADNCRHRQAQPADPTAQQSSSATSSISVARDGSRPTRKALKRRHALPAVEVPELSVSEVRNAEFHWFANAQQDSYSDVIKAQRSGQPLPKAHALSHLMPEWDGDAKPGLLRMNGRLKTAHHLPSGARRPIILPGKHPVTALRIAHEDVKCKHVAGKNHLLANLNGEFWVVGGLGAVKAHRRSCPGCKLQWAKPAEQLMAPLPSFRTAEPVRAFHRAGVDFAGPFLTKQGRGRVKTKRYLCVFTCLQSRAVHLEMAYSLDTDGFLLALSRFVKRRGRPALIVSDNGTNFVAAEKELRDAVEQLNSGRVSAALASEHIEWRFNPPQAPHHGGVFESMVKCAKRALRGILEHGDCTDEELSTAFIVVEAFLNTRPLTTISSDPSDLTPLTPQHFLTSHADLSLALEELADQADRVNPRHRWKAVQRLSKDVWDRWLKELVPALNLRQRWRNLHRNVRVGEVVLFLEPGTPRGKWPLARILQVYPGKDGNVRVVDILVRGKTYRRPINVLVPLEVDSE